ncbi:MAG: dihydrofolate reductase family protein [archaeon]
MRKIVILSFVTLDNVMQAPGGKGEDPSNGFDYEGWVTPYWDKAGQEEMDRQMSIPYDLLLGRKTYDIFADYWPSHPEEGASLNAAVKYVATRGGTRDRWDKTVFITGDVTEKIKALKAQEGPMLQVHGSGELIQTLLKHDLADELWLKIFPIVLGRGKRLFEPGISPAAFHLTEQSVTPSGVILARYERSGHASCDV